MRGCYVFMILSTRHFFYDGKGICIDILEFGWLNRVFVVVAGIFINSF